MEPANHCIYDQREQFSAWETACLIAGFDPAGLDQGDLSSAPKVKILSALIEDAYQNALYCSRALCLGQTVYRDGIPVEYCPSNSKGTPIQFGVSATPSTLPSVEIWEACEHAIKSGNGLDAYAEKLLSTKHASFWRNDIKKWLKEIDWKEARYFASSARKLQESPIGTRERETMLKLIIGMAIKGYDYDPNAKKNEATGQIAASLQGIGLPVSDETIRKYLKEAAELLPRKSPAN
ncbi:hypothetical protein [Bordetella tumulicola]|uniref:hypothetical protein n=1 Tax=Bordetella tumulicola TaxID=1649133 RepID=UPI0039F05367